MTLLQDRPARQSSDCHHSREPFDTVFRCIAERRDISPTAKLVHGRLVSQHRLGAAWTQTEIGEALGLSRHQVWRAIAELIAAGLLLTIRYGLGRPNGYVLLGIDAADLQGKADRRPAGQQAAGRPASRARDLPDVRNSRKNRGSGTPLQAGDCFGCGGQHPASACPTYGYLTRR